MKPDDKALVLKFKKGDRYAFEMLVSRYKRKLYSVIYRMVRNHQITDDMLQETFLKMFKNIDKYDDKYPFYPWLYRIAVNNTLNYIKKNKKRKKDRSLEEEVEERHRQFDSHHDCFDPEITASRTERDKRILQALEEVSPVYRTTLILRVFEGLSYKEIAEILSCSIGTVMSRLNRARKQMRELLKDYLKNGIGTPS